MIRLLTLCFCAFLLGSCTQRMICPAYQSAFIYDKPTQKETFVYFNENRNQPREILASNSKTITLPAKDSTWSKSDVLPGPSLPKERRVKKDRYLLLPEKTYRKALRSLQTVSMKPVYPKKQKDSLDMNQLIAGAELDSASSLAAKNDSTSSKKKKQDSVYVISVEKEKFNLDQDNYMWYFRDILVLPDVRAGMESKEQANEQSTTKKKGGFFKNLFKKKQKQKPDSLAAKAMPENDSLSNSQPKQKKGIGGLFKKKAKVDPAKAPKKKTDPAKKEEENDGF